MREIEFRGKSLNKGEWIYGDLTRDYLPFSEDPFWYINYNTKELGTLPEAVLEETVGQYTGLKDKNGKKIFEGDILEFQPEDFRGFLVKKTFKGKVEWDNDCACWLVDGIGCGVFRFNNDLGMIVSDEKAVIGNIWDNPELLEVEK